jgi:hypothetical protein
LLTGRLSFSDAVFAGGKVSFRNVEYHNATKIDFEAARFEGTAIDWGPMPVPAHARPDTDPTAAKPDKPESLDRSSIRAPTRPDDH